MRRSRSSNISIAENPVVIDKPTDRDREIFAILHPAIGHRFLYSSWLRYHFNKGDTKDQRFYNRLGHLREAQNAYLKWSDAPLNDKRALNAQSIYELAKPGADVLGLKIPALSKHEYPHELIVSLHECSLKWQAEAAGIPFSFLTPEEYELGDKHWLPDGHPIVLGFPGKETLIHSEIERRHYNESPQKTEEKIDKVLSYMEQRLWAEEGFNSSLTLFLSTSDGRTRTLMDYVAAKTDNSCSYIGFATTKDWVWEKAPDPKQPLVPQWERVGHPPLNLFERR